MFLFIAQYINFRGCTRGWWREVVVDATTPHSHFALLMPKNGLFINELYWNYKLCAFGSLFLQLALLFQNAQNLETLEYHSHMVMCIFLPIGHIRILSIGNGRSFRGISLKTDK